MAEGYVQTDLGERPSIDHLFRVFSHPRRRLVLRTLLGRPLPTGTSALARAIANSEGVRSDEVAFGETVATFESSLVHVHLPVLDEAGLINWNRETAAVSLSATALGMPIVSQLTDSWLRTAFFGTDE